jgi:ribose 5-phosphate isomerase B
MKIAVGSDHRGFQTKERLKNQLVNQGHDVSDCGAESEASSDYPDFTIPVCLKVARGEAERGILLCGTGIGMTMAANKIGGIRAALCHDELTAEMSRRHNDANVLCLPADLLSEELIRRMVDVWLTTPFEGGRHARRIAKVMAAERYLASLDAPPPDEPEKKKTRKKKTR